MFSSVARLAHVFLCHLILLLLLFVFLLFFFFPLIRSSESVTIQRETKNQNAASIIDNLLGVRKATSRRRRRRRHHILLPVCFYSLETDRLDSDGDDKMSTHSGMWHLVGGGGGGGDRRRGIVVVVLNTRKTNTEIFYLEIIFRSIG